ncbi:MAG: penicillin-binding protein 2 [Chloroflexi bacterium]|nr:penicillin-binding protein 2 [Chloroflexota bacterium]
MFNRVPRWRVKKRRNIDEETLLRVKFIVFRVVVVAAFLSLLGQVWHLQVVEGTTYQKKAEYNRLRVSPLSAKRGIIYDRGGNILVRNVPSFTVAVVPADLSKEQQPQVAARLGKLLGMPADKVTALIDERRTQQFLFAPVPIQAEVPPEVAFTVRERLSELPGVTVLVEPMRYYPEGELMSHILGYVGRISAEEYDRLKDSGYDLNDELGKMGVEATYEKALRGKPGREQVEVNANGLKLQTIKAWDTTPGQNLVLSIDLDLQRKMMQYLKEGMEDSHFAAAAAMDPRTGEVLATVSIPSYDNNIFSGSVKQDKLAALLKDPWRPLFNYTISGTFPSGSIFKIVTGSAALQEGVAVPGTEIVSTGQISIANQYDPSIVYTFKDWAALGRLDFYKAIAQSSDVYFYYLAGGFRDFKGLGIERLARYAREFGLGGKTGIDLPGEVEGLVPDAIWKDRVKGEPWMTGDTYNMGIGQGDLLVTPIQMLNMVQAVANRGVIRKPQVVRQVVDAEGRAVQSLQDRGMRKIKVSPGNLDIVAEGMRQAVEWGTATLAKIPGVTVAGKTGTAEWGPIDPATGYRPYHGWFVGFAPFDNPEIAIVVFVEKGKGALVATPIAGKILDYYFHREQPVAKGQ